LLGGDGMKRTLTLVCLLGALVLLSSCARAGITRNAEIHIGSSTIFSEAEIQSAMDAVLEKFRDFRGCDLLRLWYDEVESNRHIQMYMTHGRGSVNAVEQENVIILFSDFHAGSRACPSLNRNSVHTDWKWILIRESETCEWVVDDWGY